MERSADEQFLHDWVIRQINRKYSRLYSEVHINPGNEKNYDFKEQYPDAVFVNYGQVVQIVEVETSETVLPDTAGKWKQLSELGVKLSLLVPKESQGEARDICWKSDLAAKVNISTYDVNITI